MHQYSYRKANAHLGEPNLLTWEDIYHQANQTSGIQERERQGQRGWSAPGEERRGESGDEGGNAARPAHHPPHHQCLL